jgi:hypothetical protein
MTTRKTQQYWYTPQSQDPSQSSAVNKNLSLEPRKRCLEEIFNNAANRDFDQKGFFGACKFVPAGIKAIRALATKYHNYSLELNQAWAQLLVILISKQGPRPSRRDPGIHSFYQASYLSARDAELKQIRQESTAGSSEFYYRQKNR